MELFEVIDAKDIRRSRSGRKTKHIDPNWDSDIEFFSTLLSSINRRRQMLRTGEYDEDKDPHARWADESVVAKHFANAEVNEIIELNISNEIIEFDYYPSEDEDEDQD